MPSACSLLSTSVIMVAIALAPMATVAQSSWDQVLPKVKQKCARDYPDDFSMQAFCIKRQHEGWVAVNGADTPDTDSRSQASQQQSATASPGSADDGVEAQFVAIVEKYKKAYDDAVNDMQKGGLRPERGRALCAINSSTNIRNWHGMVYSLSSNSDGNGVIEIDLGNGVYVESMNNSFSDAGYHTLIPFGTPLFKQVAQLSKGANIIFSGNLFHDPLDCFKETSLTVRGAMTEPEFVVRITSLGRQQFTPDAVAPLPAQESSNTTSPQEETAAFTDGKNARMDYEQWFSGLSDGDYRNGAGFWASHRSDRQLPSCRTGSGDFQAGCLEAAHRLAAADIRRRADADFKRGWNSL